jgi:hypothetical protein
LRAVVEGVVKIEGDLQGQLKCPITTELCSVLRSDLFYELLVSVLSDLDPASFSA